MTRRMNILAMLLTAAVLLLAADRAAAGTNIRDIARLMGSQENRLIGIGIVDGLAGTGDGSKNVQALRSLAQMLQRFDINVEQLDDISADNIAFVRLSVTIPETGARVGDQLDVQISALNGAESLEGGRLVTAALLGPTLDSTRPWALAEGDISLEDPDTPTVAVVRNGAIMERDFIPEYIAEGTITIVLDRDHASFAMASTVAKVINDALAEPGQRLAYAANAANVLVRIPSAELSDPAEFIALVMGLPVLMPDRQARVVINRRTGTIVFTEDVEIEPVVIFHNGLTINVTEPEPEPTVVNPRVRVEDGVLLDPADEAKASLRDLVDAFNQFQVPVESRIAIIQELQRTGRLHARVIEE